MNATLSLTKDYDENAAKGYEKTKPKQTQPVVSLYALSEAEGSNVFQNRPDPQKEQQPRPACPEQSLP